MDQTQLLSWEAEEEQLRDSDRQARGRLRVFAGSQGPETGFLVYTGENVIGRHESCHIRIPAQSVSKKHAVIEIEGDTHLIHDCNSLNKTRRRNAILKPSVRYAINDGDLFLFADVACQYALLPAEDGDSGSETGSESVFPQSRAGEGGQRPDGVASDGLVSKAADGEMESAEDSLMLSPTQPFQTKSSLPFRPDTYVKESEDDDTPWKGPFVPQDGRYPNSSVRETPSAHIVPESDDEGGDSSCSKAQSMQLHYDSDTDLEEDEQPCVKWVEASPAGPANGNCVNSETGGAKEQRGDNPATGVVAPGNHSAAARGAVSIVETLDHDAGRGSAPGPGAPAPADLLPHFSWDSDSDSEVGLKSDSPAEPTETNSRLAEGADVREADAVARDRHSSLIRPDEGEGSIKADDNMDSSAGSDGQAKGTVGSGNQGELLEVNSDTDADDDDTEAYAVQATQCFTFRVSDTQDERSGEDDYPPDGDTAATEEATQLFISESPTFDKGTCQDNTASMSNAEDEATQLFTLESPAFGHSAFKKPIPSGCDRGGQLGKAEGNVAAASETEEEATQPFMAGAVTQWPRDSAEPGGEQQAGANQEDQWANVETQPFCLESQADEESERAESAAPTSPVEGAPAPTSQDQPTSLSKTCRSLLAGVPKEESSVGLPATTDQPETPPDREGGRSWHERTLSSSQESELVAGRKRRVASQSESEKLSSSPPQAKTRRTARPLSTRSPSGSLPDSGSPPKIMFTGMVDEDGVKVIQQLGGEVVESVHDSTHLVTDRIRRTVKFLCAVARGIPVVSPEWLKMCGKSSCFLSTRGFLLDDSEQEQKFSFRLAESLQKAREEPLLKDFRVHVTPGVLPEPGQMESIVQCSGATILPKMPRAYKEKTLVISCPDDLPKCKAARDAGVPVLNAEFILTGILQQTVDLVSYRLDGESDSQPEGKKRTATTQSASSRKKKR